MFGSQPFAGLPRIRRPSDIVINFNPVAVGIGKVDLLNSIGPDVDLPGISCRIGIFKTPGSDVFNKGSHIAYAETEMIIPVACFPLLCRFYNMEFGSSEIEPGVQPVFKRLLNLFESYNVSVELFAFRQIRDGNGNMIDFSLNAGGVLGK